MTTDEMPKSSIKIMGLTALRQNLPRLTNLAKAAKPSRHHGLRQVISVNQRNCRVIAISTLRSPVNLPRHHCHVTDRYGRYRLHNTDEM